METREAFVVEGMTYLHPGLFRLFCPSCFAANMAVEVGHAVVQETLEHLDSCQEDDFNRILLRMEYLNRTIIIN